MPGCVVKLCKNNTTRNKKDTGISYHLFPADPVIFNRWIAIVRLSREECCWKPGNRSVICSAHFKESDLYFTKGGLKRLSKGAVPQNALFLSSTPTDNISNISAVTAEPSKSALLVERTIIVTDEELNSGDDVTDDSTVYEEASAPKRKKRDRGRRATGAGVGAEHPGLQCGNCSGRITGFRYTCVQCEDFDLCAACEARAVHDHHYVLRVPGPRPHGEVVAVVARVRRELLGGIQPLVASGDDGDSVKVEVKLETDPGPDPLQDDEPPAPYYPELPVEVVTEPLKRQSNLDMALQTIKLETESDDEALVPAVTEPKPQHTAAEDRKPAVVRQQQNIMVEVPPAKRRFIKTDAGVVTQGPAATQTASTSLDPVEAQRDSGSFGFEVFTHSKGGGVAGRSPDTGGGASRGASAAMRQTKKARSRAPGAEQQRGAKRK